jgi:hypothetical protein
MEKILTVRETAQLCAFLFRHRFTSFKLETLLKLFPKLSRAQLGMAVQTVCQELDFSLSSGVSELSRNAPLQNSEIQGLIIDLWSTDTVVVHQLKPYI